MFSDPGCAGVSFGRGSRLPPAATGPVPMPRFRPQSSAAATRRVRSSRISDDVLAGRHKALAIEKNKNFFAAGVSDSQASTRLSTNPQRVSWRSPRSASESSSSSQMVSPTRTCPSLAARGNRHFLLDPTQEMSASTTTFKGMNKGRNTPTSIHSWWGDIEAAARALHDDMDPHGGRFNLADGMKWDRLTIRQWFSFMGVEPKEMKHVMPSWRELDADNDGILDFEEFVEIFKRISHYFQYRSKSSGADGVDHQWHQRKCSASYINATFQTPPSSWEEAIN